MQKKIIQKLSQYFNESVDISFAFLFGSRSKDQGRVSSDWDIGVYFAPEGKHIEYENASRDYPQEGRIAADLARLLHADRIDLIVLNRAPAGIADAAIRGVPIVIKDRKIWLEFMLVVTGLAEEYRQFVKEYYEIAERSKSLSEEDKSILRRSVQFIKEQMLLYEVYKLFSQKEYEDDPRKRNEIERWLENLVNAVIDMSKIVVGSKKRPIPQTYRETVEQAIRSLDLPDDFVLKFDQWVDLRNMLAHEYLDIKWRRLSEFAKVSQSYFSDFIHAVKQLLNEKK